MHLEYLTPVQVSSKDGNLGASAIHIGQLQQELDRMLDMAQDNIETSFDAVLSRNSSLLTKAEKMESYLDFLNKEISKYISRLLTYETNEQGSSIVSSYFTSPAISSASATTPSTSAAIPSCWRNGTSSSPPRLRRRSARCGTSVWRR